MNLLWDVRVSLDLFLGGLGVGAFLVGAVLYYMDAKTYEGVIKKAFIIAPVLVIAGLLLLLTLALGIVLGLLLGVQIFRVFQTSWEIKRLRKDIDHLRKEQIQLAQQAAADAAANVRHEKTVLDIQPETQNRNPL